MTVIPAACACLLLMSLCVWGQDCPTFDANLEPASDDVLKGYSAISDEAEENLKKVAPAVASGFEDAQNCPIPDTPEDLAKEPKGISKRAAVPVEISPIYGRSCEPCPPRVHFLHRFYDGRCYVIFPYQQWVRYVTCPFRTNCRKECWCSNTRCVPTRYIPVWIWAWCVDRGLPGGYWYGLNWRWLWLPQDCQCQKY